MIYKGLRTSAKYQRKIVSTIIVWKTTMNAITSCVHETWGTSPSKPHLLGEPLILYIAVHLQW